jgi:hypothetical protein
MREGKGPIYRALGELFKDVVHLGDGLHLYYNSINFSLFPKCINNKVC